MRAEPTTAPSRSTSEPSAFDPKATWAMPVTTSGYTDPDKEREGDEHHDGGGQLAAHHTTPKAERMTSMTLMPTNGATMPPSP